MPRVVRFKPSRSSGHQDRFAGKSRPWSDPTDTARLFADKATCRHHGSRFGVTFLVRLVEHPSG